jgi:hypothetical protein
LIGIEKTDLNKVVSICIAIVICSVQPGYSQTGNSGTKRFSVGITGGLNLADMYLSGSQGNDKQDITPMGRYGLGAVLGYSLSDYFDLLIEPMYLQKGGMIQQGSDPVTQPEGQIRTESVEFPLLMKNSYGDQFQPYLLAGVSVGFNLKSEIEYNISGLQFTGDLNDVTQTVDAGFILGIGIQVPAGIFKIFMESRYVHGVLNQRRSGTVSLSSGSIQMDVVTDKDIDRFTSRGLQFMFGLILTL